MHFMLKAYYDSRCLKDLYFYKLLIFYGSFIILGHERCRIDLVCPSSFDITKFVRSFFWFENQLTHVKVYHFNFVCCKMWMIFLLQVKVRKSHHSVLISYCTRVKRFITLIYKDIYYKLYCKYEISINWLTVH